MPRNSSYYIFYYIYVTKAIFLMDFQKLSKYIANNNLPEEEICETLRAAISEGMASRYSKGYADCMRHSKRHREARKARLEKEFDEYRDFISDLTHDKR